jgi:hypothetical protein
LIDIGVLCSRTEDKLSYPVVVQCLSQMLCSFSTDFVVIKTESGECLYWSIMVYYAVEQKTSCVTVLLCSAWARCCAPSAPILFHSRFRVVSVYMKTQIKSNAFKCLKVNASHSFMNHFLLFTTLLGAVLDRFLNAILHKGKFIIRACLRKGSICVVMLYIRYCLRFLEWWDMWQK